MAVGGVTKWQSLQNSLYLKIGISDRDADKLILKPIQKRTILRRENYVYPCHYRAKTIYAQVTQLTTLDQRRVFYYKFDVNYHYKYY